MHKLAPGMMTILAAIALGGCANMTDRPAAIAPPAPSGILYACVPVGPATASTATMVPLRLLVRDVQQHQLVLDVGNAASQRLYPVGDGSAPVYANSSYAWKSSGVHSRLTDIVNIQAYDCMRSGGQ